MKYASKRRLTSAKKKSIIQQQVCDDDASSDDLPIKRTNVAQPVQATKSDFEEIAVGDIVFARLSSRAPWWPAVVIDPKMCGYQSNDKAWVFWLGDNRISDVEATQVRLFADGFNHCFRIGGTQNYIQSICKAIELYTSRLGITYPDEPLEWAGGHFSSQTNKIHRTVLSTNKDDKNDSSSSSSSNDSSVENRLPNFIVDRLKAIKNLQSKKSVDDSFDDENGAVADDECENSDTSSASNGTNSLENHTNRFNNIEREARRVSIGKYSLEQFCICCGTIEALKLDHPLFEGKMCKTCTTCYKEICFVYDQDNKKEHCSICGSGGDLFICDNSNCANVFCQDCVVDLDSIESLDTISNSDPWYCYICNLKSSGFIRPRHDWESRLFALFKTTNILDDVDLTLISTDKQPIRVLSLFDGVGTAKIVMDELGLDIGAYYCSEIDSEAMLVTKVNHPNALHYLGDVREVDLEKLKEIGPIDVVIGGSPCNDISIANPKRKGLYDPSGTGILFFEFFRILQTVLQLNLRQKRNTFWLFENVASMRMEYRSVIDRYLGRLPALYDSCHFSAQNRARYFWGNIPGMYNYTVPVSNQPSPRVEDILVPNCGRIAKMEKVRTVTTRTNSLKQGRQFSVCPVEMDGKPDTLWPTELETLFGLPRHYTDVGSLSPTKRQKLIGQGWTVPVVKHILRPLLRFFKIKDAKR